MTRKKTKVGEKIINMKKEGKGLARIFAQILPEYCSNIWDTTMQGRI